MRPHSLIGICLFDAPAQRNEFPPAEAHFGRPPELKIVAPPQTPYELFSLSGGHGQEAAIQLPLLSAGSSEVNSRGVRKYYCL